jgi:hypothetical protein
VLLAGFFLRQNDKPFHPSWPRIICAETLKAKTFGYAIGQSASAARIVKSVALTSITGPGIVLLG